MTGFRLLICAILSICPAIACSCVGGLTTCGLLSSSKVAFIGTVLEGTEAEQIPGRTNWGDKPAKLRVETIVRGLEARTVEILVNPSISTSCYMPMKPGQRWLVLGGMSGDVVMTGGCTGSRTIPPGDTSVMDAVESFLKGPNLVRAEVRQYQGWDTAYKNESLLPDAEVSLVGAERAWSGRTNRSGAIQFRDLPPGEYEVQVKMPGLSLGLPSDTRWNSNERFSPKIKLEGRGCVDAPLILYREQGIRGTVRDEQGRPMPGVNVGAFEIRSGNRVSSASVRATVTDADGNYYLPRLPDGTYVVGANADEGFDGSAYRAKYHPAAHSRQSAARISVNSQTSEAIDILMDPPRRSMEMQIKVVSSDGKPAPNAYISLSRDDIGSVRFDARAANSQLTNSEGIATLRLWEGDEYSMYALLTPRDRPTSVNRTLTSDTIRIKASVGVVPVLTLKAPK